MGTEQNKELVRRFMETVWNAGDAAAAEGLLTPDFRLRHAGLPGPIEGVVGLSQFLTAARSAFPDLTGTIEELIAEAGQAAARLTWRGTHLGEFNGIPPTGRTFIVGGMATYRIEEGRIAEAHVALDVLGQLQQLGVVPALGQPLACPRSDAGEGESAVGTETNKELVRRLYAEAVDTGDPAAVNALVAADYRCSFPASAPPMDREGLKAFIAAFRAAFPDAHHAVEELVAEGDRVVARVTARGTHTGMFQASPPTGRSVTLTAISIYRIRDGRIVEECGEGDLLGLLQQLDAISAPAQGQQAT